MFFGGFIGVMPFDASKRKFNKLEDDTILRMYATYGKKCWKTVGMMLGRNPRTCRERYRNYLSQNIESKPWTKEEDEILFEKYKDMGPKWIDMTHFLPGRTDVNIKNRWALLKRHRAKQGTNQIQSHNSDSNSTDATQDKQDVDKEKESNSSNNENDPFEFLQIEEIDDFAFEYF